MMKKLLTISLLSASFAVFGQTQINMTGDAWLVLDNGAAIVIDHSSPNGIRSTSPSFLGNISSEGEFDRVQWNIRNATGAYTVPFTTNSGVKIPLTMDITGAGSTDGSILFATYNHEINTGANWNNDLYRPSDVTHMNDWATGSVNNSDYVVDRFWIIDADDATYGYTTRPTPRFTFRYDPVTDLAGGNAITAATSVGAQRFNNTVGEWGDLLPVGVGSAGLLANISITNTDFYRSWTLTGTANPLPIELLGFDGTCNSGVVELKWTTASELNNDFFTIERSDDGLSWEAVGTVQGAGTSNQTLDYTFADVNATTLAYYRLAQTDFDGTTTRSDILAAGCEGTGGTQIVNAWDDGNTVTLVVSSSDLGNYDLTVTDAQGKEMMTRPSQVINEGTTSLNFSKGHLATGVYMLRLHNGDEVLTRRIVLN